MQTIPYTELDGIHADAKGGRPLLLEIGDGHGNAVTVVVPAGRKQEARRIERASDEGGTIQAIDALALFPGRPELHTTMSIMRAFQAADFEIRD